MTDPHGLDTKLVTTYGQGMTLTELARELLIPRTVIIIHAGEIYNARGMNTDLDDNEINYIVLRHDKWCARHPYDA